MIRLFLSLLCILPVSLYAQIFGSAIVISSELAGPRDIHTADLDGDGDLDIITASADDSTIAWFENVDQVFGSPQIISQNANGASAVYAADLDGDGDMDVVSASRNDAKIAWYANDGAGNFGTETVLLTNMNQASDVHAADLDLDGDIDIVCSAAASNTPIVRLLWNDGVGNFSSNNTAIWAYIATSVFVEDLDGDNLPDVLCSSFGADKISWAENYNDLSPGYFSGDLIISNTADGAQSVFAADLDGDGDIDVISASWNDDTIAWYENDGEGNFTESIISTNVNMAKCVKAADVDGDGDIDILASSHGSKIYWYENDGFGTFSDAILITSLPGYYQNIWVSDLDGDGDPDVLAANSLDDTFTWYDNQQAGCADPLACNYNTDMPVEISNCCYDDCGCTDPSASNYSALAACDDGSCNYLISGVVFNDLNFNGVFDGEDYGLALQSISIEPGGLTLLTDDNGEFSIELPANQNFTFTHTSNEVFDIYTTPNPKLDVDPETATTAVLEFGVSSEQPAYDIDVSIYPINGMPCDSWVEFLICARNMGNVPIEGTVAFTYDDLFQDHAEITPLDSTNGNTLYMSFQNLLPGQNSYYHVDLLSPTAENFGAEMICSAEAIGYFNENEVASGSETLDLFLACAYDPNDKQAFPLGYTEDHLLLSNMEQEFLIRFQNTGNAYAQHVHVQDTLDANFDMASFRLVGASHNVLTTINTQTGLIDFYFENIQLPDSISNEPDSHGFVAFGITPLAELSAGTVLHNTAYIYFDNNEAIVTNTTWTTIHECGGEADFIFDQLVNCSGQLMEFTAIAPLIERYTWTVDGEGISEEPVFETTFSTLGDYEVSLEASNPLCTETSMVTVVIDDLSNYTPCPGDLNCDGHRLIGDLTVLLAEFGCSSDCENDINQDGVTSIADLVLFLSYFGQSCWE